MPAALSGPEQDASLPGPPPRRSSLLGSVVRGCGWGAVLALSLEFGRVLFGDNFHTVVPGELYRSAQLSAGHLERVIRAHGIRTVVCLRGFCGPGEWYQDECRVTHALNVSQQDVGLSAYRLPATHEMRRLVEVLDRSERPLLLHCVRGSDRTGLASATAMLLRDGVPLETAKQHLTLRAGHVPLGRPAILRQFFDLYTEWLAANGLEHAPGHFRRWAQDGYCPGACRCRITLLEPDRSLLAGRPVVRRVRVENTSVRTWLFSPEPNTGVHLDYVLKDARTGQKVHGKAGLFDAIVAPGDSIDLMLSLPAMRAGRLYHLAADMKEAGHCAFAQAGSEPLEEELVAREGPTSETTGRTAAPGRRPRTADSPRVAN